MFRGTKRKPATKKIVRSTAADDKNDKYDTDTSDGFAAPSAVLANKKRKLRKAKTTGLVVRSFDVGEADDDDDADRRKSKKKKRRRGFGFGGVADASHNGDAYQEIDVPHNEEIDSEVTTDVAPSYGKEALERLRSEQKLKSPEAVVVQKQLATTGDVEQHEPLAQDVASPKGGPADGNSASLASFIAFDSEDHHDITDSRETMFIRENSADYNTPGRFGHELPSIHPGELHAWEDQIERRAGIKPSSANATKHSRLVSLKDLGQKLQSTMIQIQSHQEELQNSTNRRRADYEHASAECKIQEETLETTGAACEFYQRLRQDLTLWVGALRDLEQKVLPIKEAFREMLVTQNSDAAANFDIFQDDCIATLQEHGLLNRVVGRQSFPPSTHGESTIDEFGRDIRSQYLRDRDLRFRSRTAKLTGAPCDDQSIVAYRDLLRGMYEDHNENERSETLHEALRSAVQDIDHQFTSALELKAIFDRWKTAYPDDFKQSFASLSFGDLTAILLQLELCRSTWFPDMLSESNNTPAINLQLEPFLQHIRDNAIVRNGNEEVTERALSKSFLPMIVEFLKAGSSPLFLFLSFEKSKIITDFLELTSQHLEHAPFKLRSLQDTVSNAIARSLDEIAIPILWQGADKEGLEINDEVMISMTYAKSYIVTIIREMLCNIITHWFRLLPLDSETSVGIPGVFSFMNDSFLMLLSSVEHEVAGKSFRAVWQALNDDPRQPLQSSAFMLMTTPLRAAAQVYQVT